MGASDRTGADQLGISVALASGTVVAGANSANAPNSDQGAAYVFEDDTPPANRAPDAVDDSATVAQDSSANAIAVLANDSDPDGDALSTTAASDPPNGAARCDADDCAYTPDPGFSGSDSFTYTISDGRGGSDTATVSVTVQDGIAPATPTITGSDPASPSSDTTPEIEGTAEAGASVRLYTSADCSGSEVASGQADGSGVFSIGVSVASGISTTFYASARDAAGNTSGCSGGFNIFIRDRLLGRTTIVSDPGGALRDANGASFMTTISYDGRFVGFTSVATNLVPLSSPVDDGGEVYVVNTRPRSAAEVGSRLASPEPGRADFPALSGDGRFVSYSSSAPGPRYARLPRTIRVREVATGANVVVTVGPDGHPIANYNAFNSALSGTGRYAVFETGATLTPADCDSRSGGFGVDVYLL